MRIEGVEFQPPVEDGPVLAFATLTLAGDIGRLVIHDVKIIDGRDRVFLCMPSRKRHFRCPKCRAKNPVASNYCNECGARVAGLGGDGRDHHDIVHPIDLATREAMTRDVLARFHAAGGREAA